MKIKKPNNEINIRKEEEKKDSFKYCKLINDIKHNRAEPKIRKKKLNEIFIINKKKKSKK